MGWCWISYGRNPLNWQQMFHHQYCQSAILTLSFLVNGEIIHSTTTQQTEKVWLFQFMKRISFNSIYKLSRQSITNNHFKKFFTNCLKYRLLYTKVFSREHQWIIAFIRLTPCGFLTWWMENSCILLWKRNSILFTLSVYWIFALNTRN